MRKRYPLIQIGLPISFILEGQAFCLTTSELSHEEVRVNCRASEIPKLVPRTAHHRPDEKILHRALVELGNDETLELELQVSFCRRYSQKEFKVGFQIKQLRDDQQETLQQRLEQALSDKAQPVSFIN